MKKMMRLDKDDYREMSYEDVLDRYSFYIRKKIRSLSVYSKAKYHLHSSLFDDDDIKQYIYMGIYKAYNKYDIERDIAFYSYMDKMAEGEVLRHIRDLSGERRSVSAYQFKHSSLDSQQSLNNYSGDSDVSLSDIIKDDKDYIGDFINTDHLNSVMNILNDEEKVIVNKRFFEEVSQVELGKRLNVSQVQISRKEKKIISKLREEYKKKEGIKEMKLDIQNVISYLSINASKDIAISKAIGNYCKIHKISVSTVFTALGRAKHVDTYNDLKSRYKDTNMISPKKREKMTAPVKAEETCKMEKLPYVVPELKTVHYPPKSVNIEAILKASGSILSTEEACKPAERIAKDLPVNVIEDVDNNLKALKGLNIKSLVLESESFDASFVENGIKLIDLGIGNRTLSLVELEAIKSEIDKIIDIYKAIY